MTEDNSLMVRRGLYFEEFAVGQAVLTPGRTVTEADVVAFAGLSGDWNPIHTDAEYAARHPFGQRVAHGLLGLSIAVGLCVRLGFLDETFLAFRAIENWKFSRPIFIGDTIHARVTVSDTRPVRRLDGGMVFFQVEILNQAEEVLQQGVWSALMKSRAVVEPGT